jgi:hypothetical protein
MCSAVDRRAVLGGFIGAVASAAWPLAASAKIESVNPANNYYFPMAKYRYLPRILRAWIAVDQLAPAALEVAFACVATPPRIHLSILVIIARTPLAPRVTHDPVAAQVVQPPDDPRPEALRDR